MSVTALNCLENSGGCPFIIILNPDSTLYREFSLIPDAPIYTNTIYEICSVPCADLYGAAGSAVPEPATALLLAAALLLAMAWRLRSLGRSPRS